MNIISLIRFSLLIVIIQFFRNNLAAVRAPNYAGPEQVKKLIKHILQPKYEDEIHPFSDLLENRDEPDIWTDVFENTSRTPSSLECKCEYIKLDLGETDQPKIIKVLTFYCPKDSANVDNQQYRIMNGFFENSVITVKEIFNELARERSEVKYEPQSLWYLSPGVEEEDNGNANFENFTHIVDQFSATSRLYVLDATEATALCQLAVGHSDNIVNGFVMKKSPGLIMRNSQLEVTFPPEMKFVALHCEDQSDKYLGIQDMDNNMLLSKYSPDSANEIIFEKSLFEIGILDKLVTDVNKEVFGYESPPQSSSS